MRKAVHRSIPLWLCTFALILVLTVAPAISCAETTHTLGGRAPSSAQYFEYTVDSGRAILTKYIGPDSLKTVIVPSQLGGWPVVEIGASAFDHAAKIRKVILPIGIERIGSSAFENCSSLVSISIPSSVTDIGTYAFSGCKKLTSMKIPKGVTTISIGTFSGCNSLRNLRILGQITEIGREAFDACAFSKVIIGPNVRSIGEAAFADCRKLKSINVSSKNEWYSSEDGVLYDKDKSVLLIYPSARSAANFKVPSSVRRIGDASFSQNKHLKSVSMGNQVTSIGCAFWLCTKLKKVILSKSISCIETDTFFRCNNLKKIEIPEGVVKLDAWSLFCSNDLHAFLPNSVKNFGWDGETYGDYDVFMKGTTLHVYEGSAAQQYAIRKGFNYVLR